MISVGYTTNVFQESLSYMLSGTRRWFAAVWYVALRLTSIL